MNQRRHSSTTGDFVDKSRGSSLNENVYSRTLPANVFASLHQSPDTRTQPVLYDTPPVSTGQSYYQSVSRSTPVKRPRPETAVPFVPQEYRQRLQSSSLQKSPAPSKSLEEPSFYSVEEHHDALTLPSVTHQYATLRTAPLKSDCPPGSTLSDQHSASDNKDDLLNDVESLLAVHLPSSSRSYSYQRRDYSSTAPRTSGRAPHEARTETSNTDTRRPAHFPAPATSTTAQPTAPFTKPQVYCAEEREVERLTYRPASFSSSTNPRESENPSRYPIVELSVPKPSTHRSSSLDIRSNEIPVTEYDSNFSSSWSRLGTHSTNQRDYSRLYRSPRSEHFSPTPQETIKTSSQRLQSSNIRSNFDKLSSALNRSFYEQADSLINTTSGNTSSGHKLLDISSLDALLESAFDGDDEDMSKSTKEWRSSFSSMRDRFGSRELSDELTANFVDFTTNGSLTLPRRGLSKSASQGSMILGRRSESTLLGRNTSLLADAVDAIERRAAEAPELIRRNSRQELGNFWAETVRNSSSTATVQRTPLQLSAAQRLEMLHDSLDTQGTDMRFSRGESIAARRAQFLKETMRSNISSSSLASGRAPSGRSTPMPNGYMNSTVIRMDISEEETTVTEKSGAPNFSALDNAVAELSTGSRTFTTTRSGGCARFPTGDLASLSPTTRKDASSTTTQPHSPSPDAGSDASSNYNAPSGLPHPKPKHNIREQLIQAGFELRGFSYVRSFGARFASSPNFPVPSNGSVASRISEFEKRPGVPNLLQIACALSGIPQRTDGSAIRSPLGPMSPRSSVYRTKPIIHADLGGTSPKPHVEANGSPASMFQFPPSKQLFDVKEEISYYSRESVAVKNEAQVTIISSNLDKVSLDSVQPRRTEALIVSAQNKDNQQISSPTLLERRNEKNAAATLPPPLLRADAIAPTSSSSVHTPPVPHKIRPVDVPRFYFPRGKPISMAENEAALRRVSDVFNRIGGKVEMIDMIEVCKAAGIPIYWKRAVYDSCCGAQSRPLTLADFSAWWSRMTSTAHDEAARFIYTVAGPHRNYIVKEDLAPLLQDLIESFPGLHFLREAQEFHARYVETVTVRIFWSVNRSWTGQITANELRRSNFLETIRKLETTDDINTITDYFSYEHFYVIYCKFYEIDKDHNLIINKIDMSQHGSGAIPPRVIDRIFSGAVTRSPGGRRVREALETIAYTDFVAFLLAEEDKKHPTSIEYWFRVLDLDGDGFLSLYEMEYFYNGVKSKMDQHNIDSMRFDDVVCNLLDLVRPRQPNVITLSDLKKCSMCTRFFNTFINWVKYYEQESSEGERATVTDGEEELSDWDRYCLEEYEALMADDQENEEPEDINLNLDDDDETMSGSNVSTTVNIPLRDFTDQHHSTALEAL
uniref:EF-hand domain-containing protein n=1 Tax=Parascaris univalens TaxID=6257 RepID=A0A915AVB1_PARUN